MSEQYGFFVDLTRCVGCRTCAVACRDWHSGGTESARREVKTFETGRFPAVTVCHLPLACCHCADPACRKVCPAGVFTKRQKDGAVIIDSAKCLGCRRCLAACPYGAPKYDPATSRITKCDMCAARLDAGSPPVCVEACPLRALAFGPLAELKQKYGGTDRVELIAPPNATGPSVLYKLKPDGAAD
ncbi:MAG: 4Fe-4S dicluster domain-containing protein [bacterium]